MAKIPTSPRQPARTLQRVTDVWIPDMDYRTLEVCAREMNMGPREYIARVLANKASQLRRRA